jgi:hypothetical protein
MSKDNSNIIKISLTIQNGVGDPAQDAIFAYFNSLPRTPKGNIHRYVLQSKLIAALYSYVTVNPGQVISHVKAPVVQVPVVKDTVTPVSLAKSLESVPVPTGKLDEPESPAPSTSGGSKSALRKKIASSMNG